jgi:1,4-alpha-glucan branching enzyme
MTDSPNHFGPHDLHLFNEGTHRRLWEKMGAHLTVVDGRRGTSFAVWAPSAKRVEVVGDFNQWSHGTPLQPLGSSGIWTGFVPDLGKGALYKYRVHSQHNGFREDKADPFGFLHEVAPKTASVVWDLDYHWRDEQWMRERLQRNGLNRPMSIYEVHLGSWRRVLEEGNRSLSYRELAPLLVDYVKRLGFTHVEFLPVMEHPFFGSWGYQVTGYFASTSRYGSPQDLMFLIDELHRNDIGVILDWVPSHFPTDGHGLSYFDGTHLFEHSDPRQGFHPDWQSSIFNYGRNEVRSFLTSSAIFWLKVFHADALRVDGVASMLYLDYSRESGEWIPNRYGGRENIEAIEVIRQVNMACYSEEPDTQTIAEESTAWGGVSRPPELGGLGFGLKWDMGWMHDTLQYFQREPIHRRYHHNELTFRAVYALNENFVLPLSHDEVVHGKGSLIERMPGDDWQKFANLRLLFSYMWTTPGKKLLFMGGEFAQWSEWRHDSSLDWHLTEFDRHEQTQRLVARLNVLYRELAPLHLRDFDAEGFEWVKLHDHDNSVLAYLRRGVGDDWVLVVANFTPVPRDTYTMGVPVGGGWEEIFNSDASEYGGSDFGNSGFVVADESPFEGRPFSLSVRLPPLAAVMFRPHRK